MVDFGSFCLGLIIGVCGIITVSYVWLIKIEKERERFNAQIKKREKMISLLMKENENIKMNAGCE